MYICIYVYMYICIYVYMYICIYVYMYICIYVYMYICIYVYMYICIYVYMYICIYVYMYICIYVISHIYNSNYDIFHNNIFPTVFSCQVRPKTQEARDFARGMWSLSCSRESRKIICSKVPFGSGFLLVPRRVFTIFVGAFHKIVFLVEMLCLETVLYNFKLGYVQGVLVRAAGTTLSCAIVMWKFALLPHILMRLENITAVSNSNNL